jgi:amino acid adenylation domain-containing protein
MNLFDTICEVAEKNKERIALEFGNRQVNYQEFAEKVKDFAATIVNLGVKKGDRVVIAMPRSFNMIYAIAGCLGAGAIFVPVDPLNPASRLERIFNDCSPRLVITADEVDLPIETAAKIVKCGECFSGKIFSGSLYCDTAYIIYTSGTTGYPKGVMISQKALRNYLDWATTSLPFKNGGVPLFTSISFDHAITNIFPPLLMGERIVLLPEINAGRDLAKGLVQDRSAKGEKYSYVKITPSLFKFLSEDEKALLGTMTHALIFGGEALDPLAVSAARKHSPALRIWNHYGPTEATVGCCVYEIPPGFSNPVVPIGNPIPGVEFSIRDQEMVRVTAGEPGELIISGHSLSDGYWGQEEITKQFFIDLAEEDGIEKRCYRTGDLAIVNASGLMECIGRIDDQVKILGQRVEPSGIASLIRSLPQVQNCAVVSFGASGEKQLAAAVECEAAAVTADDIRNVLKATLPASYIPRHILLFEKLPVADSGKLDIKKIVGSIKDLSVNLEEAVLEKFRDVTGVGGMGMDDDYFLFGGDSLGVVDIVVWASDKFGIDLELSCLFDFPTPSAFIGHIREVSKSI